MSDINKKNERHRIIFLVMSTLPEFKSISTYQYCGNRHTIQSVDKTTSPTDCYGLIKNEINKLEEKGDLLKLIEADTIENNICYSFPRGAIGNIDGADILEGFNNPDTKINVKFDYSKKEKKQVITEISYSSNSITRSIVEGEIEGYDSRRPTFKGISQLEAGTKYYLYKLADEGKTIDGIVVLASNETRKKVESTQNTKNEYRNREGKAVSAVELYRSRIKSYIKGEEADKFGAIDRSEEKKEYDLKGKEKYDITSDFIRIVPNENDSYNGRDNMQRLWDAAEAVRGNLKKGDMVELYIDMQGGLRHDYPAINTIITLLADQDVRVEIKERVATEFFGRNIVQPVYTVTEDYEYYDLITAYQMFKEYGRGDSLSSYFERDRAREEDSHIAVAIKEISDAIQLCKVDDFDIGLRKLGDALTNRGEELKTEMDFIIKRIRSDFGNLISRSNSTQSPGKYVEQIEWCLKHKFIQQAITILESKMPTEYVWNGLKTYCMGRDNIDDVRDRFQRIYIWYRENDKNNKYRLYDINHYWIRDYERNNDKASNRTGISITAKYPEQLRNRIKESIKKYGRICSKYRNSTNHVAQSEREGGFRKWIITNYPGDIPSEGDDMIGDIESYIKEFKNLASQVDRNYKKKVIDLS